MFLKELKETAAHFLKHYNPGKNNKEYNENYKLDKSPADSNICSDLQ
jgi:hypothetical protein